MRKSNVEEITVFHARELRTFGETFQLFRVIGKPHGRCGLVCKQWLGELGPKLSHVYQYPFKSRVLPMLPIYFDVVEQYIQRSSMSGSVRSDSQVQGYYRSVAVSFIGTPAPCNSLKIRRKR